MTCIREQSRNKEIYKVFPLRIQDRIKVKDLIKWQIRIRILIFRKAHSIELELTTHVEALGLV